MWAPDRLAGSGLWLAAAGILALPASAGLIASTPEGSRRWIFFAGLASAAALSVTGGLWGRAALIRGTTRRGRAWVATILGLTVAATLTISLAWALLGTLL